MRLSHRPATVRRSKLPGWCSSREEAGSSLDRIVSATVVLADEDDFAGMNEEWLRWFPSEPPARQGAKLPARIAGLKVSIAAIAEA
jgi:2-iminobutanoate/2-iminopropanoate deaminase